MAVKKVDEASLTAVADSIRTKAGITDQLVFPSGFVSAVQAIQAGGEDSLVKRINDTLVEFHNNEITKLPAYLFRDLNNLKKVSCENVEDIYGYVFKDCHIKEVNFPKVRSLDSGAFEMYVKDYDLKITEFPPTLYTILQDCFTNRCGVTVKKLYTTALYNNSFKNCLGLTEITFDTKCDIFFSPFTGCTNLLTINVPWGEGEVSGAPWGATNATINYNYVEGE